MIGIESPYKDKCGRTIKAGDIVRFYYSTDYPELKEPDENHNLTEMIDFVDYEYGEWTFWNIDTGYGAFAWRWNDRCEIIGDINSMKDYLQEKGWKCPYFEEMEVI